MAPTLSVFECTGIQPYVFGSNRLQENLGGSQLVWEAAERDLINALPAGALTNWQARGTTWNDTPDQAEVLYSGGGNTIVRFPDQPQAVETTTRWSRALLEKAPGLRPAAGHTDYSSGTSLADALTAAFRALDRVKFSPPPGWKLECLPVSRRCASTGLAASAFVQYRGEEPEWLSTAAVAKREARNAAAERLRNAFGGALRGYALTDQLDELTEGRGEPHIAVVHIDGNGVGGLLRQAASDAASDDVAAGRLRRFSVDVSEAARHAFRETVRRAARAASGLRLQVDGEGTPFFPLRPIVFGGDDLTFVSAGRLGLDLAATYLMELEKVTANSGAPLSACAGVALVRSHFPFSRAYALAAELCQRAKQQHREHGGGWLDFQIVSSGATGRLDQMRRAYGMGPVSERIDDRQLMRRPWRVTGAGDESHNWQLLLGLCAELSQWPRLRVKELRDAFELGGPTAVEETLARSTARRHIGGYQGYGTAFVDAIEAMEFLAPERA